MNMNWISRVALLSLFVLASVGCADFIYRHEVTGRVVDTDGKPVAGALVTRVLKSGGSEVYGLENLYRRKTGLDGSFSFVHEGLGPKPEKAMTWHLAVEAEGYTKMVTSLQVPWSDRGDDVQKTGYILKHAVVKLSPGE